MFEIYPPLIFNELMSQRSLPKAPLLTSPGVDCLASLGCVEPTVIVEVVVEARLASSGDASREMSTQPISANLACMSASSTGWGRGTFLGLDLVLVLLLWLFLVLVSFS